MSTRKWNLCAEPSKMSNKEVQSSIPSVKCKERHMRMLKVKLPAILKSSTKSIDRKVSLAHINDLWLPRQRLLIDLIIKKHPWPAVLMRSHGSATAPMVTAILNVSRITILEILSKSSRKMTAVAITRQEIDLVLKSSMSMTRVWDLWLDHDQTCRSIAAPWYLHLIRRVNQSSNKLQLPHQRRARRKSQRKRRRSRVKKIIVASMNKLQAWAFTVPDSHQMKVSETN